MKIPKRTNSFFLLQFLALCGVLFLSSACAISDKSSEPRKPAQAAVESPKPPQIPAEPLKPTPSAVQQRSSAQAGQIAEAKQAVRPAPSAQLPVKPAAVKKEKPAKPSTPSGAEPEMVSFDFEDADLQVVLRALGKLAGINFILGQGVKAQVTMRIEKIPVTEAFSIIEAILQANNLAAVKSGDIYKIVPVSAAQQQPTRIGIGDDLAEEKGYFTQIVPLQYLSADGVVNILQPLMSQGRVIAHRETNSILLSGPASVIREVVKTLKAMDVESQQREVQQTYVYYVNNAKASELANTLTALFGEARQAKRSGSEEPSALSAGRGYPPPPTPPKPGVSPQEVETLPETALQPALSRVLAPGEIRIVPDERINALIVKATARDYEFVKEVIKKLDITPKQVVIEALVAEVTLTDNFASSVEQFLRAGEVALRTSFGTDPGFLTFAFVDRDKFAIFLNMVAVQTKVNTVAAPHILTQDNKRARIQIGQEVPVITGTQSTITAVSGGGENLFQTLQRKDIGRILSILPHVNEERQVTLDIELEASDQSGTGDGDSAIFNKRSVQTSVVVEDGQSLLIGGIISDNKTREVNEIPFLGRIPFIGQFFRATNEFVDKTELLILLTPHVIANPEEGRKLTEHFRQRLRSLDASLRRIPAINGNANDANRMTPED